MKTLEKIILIDDDDTNSFLNQRLFRKIGYNAEFRVFRNGSEAFKFLQEINQQNGDPDSFMPDLLLLDVNMPVMDGFEFMEMYETLPEAFRKKIMLAFLSTSAHPNDYLKAREINIPYLIKPLNAGNLQPLLKQYFLEPVAN